MPRRDEEWFYPPPGEPANRTLSRSAVGYRRGSELDNVVPAVECRSIEREKSSGVVAFNRINFGMLLAVSCSQLY